jgi:hypothetical protein
MCYQMVTFLRLHQFNKKLICVCEKILVLLATTGCALLKKMKYYLIDFHLTIINGQFNLKAGSCIFLTFH